MTAYSRLMKITADVTLQAAILCFLLMMLCGGAQVLSRYVFNMSLDWTEEVARFMFIAVTLLGSALCVRNMGHINVDLVVLRLPAKIQRQTAVLVLAANGALFMVIFWYGIEISLATMEQLAPATGVPMGLVYAAVPLGGLLMLLFLVEQGLNMRRAKDDAAHKGGTP